MEKAMRVRFFDTYKFEDDADFESKHKRDDDGKFASTGEIHDKKELENLYGQEFKGVARQAAIRKLLEEKSGHVKNAFFNKEIGYVDLLWGNDELGLCHIIKRRTQSNQQFDAKDFVGDMSDVIQNGEVHFDAEKNNYQIWYNKKMAIVTKTFKGKEVKLVLTEFPSRKKPARFKKQA